MFFKWVLLRGYREDSSGEYAASDVNSHKLV